MEKNYNYINPAKTADMLNLTILEYEYS